uniref:Toll-like receptor 18 n=2 Tax=Latimeria chalumnae TaxID=7897 RepID=H3BE19_LATCH
MHQSTKQNWFLISILWAAQIATASMIFKHGACEIRGGDASCKGQSLFQVPRNLPPSLERIDLSYNKLYIIKNNDFAHLTKLRHLYLQFNNISKIEEGAFASNVLLEELDLFNNSLTEIPSAVLKPLTNLRKLQLSNNFYSYSTLSDVFSTLWNLTELFMGGPLIKTVRSHDFVPLQNITLEKFTLKTASSLMTYEQGAMLRVNTQVLWFDIALDENPEILPQILKDLQNKCFQLLRFRNLFEFKYYRGTVDLFAGLAGIHVKQLFFYRGKFNENLMRFALLNVQNSTIKDLVFAFVDFARSVNSSTSDTAITDLTLDHLVLTDISNPDILRFDWTFTWFGKITNLSIINVNFNTVPCDVWEEMKNVETMNITNNRLQDDFLFNQKCHYKDTMPKLKRLLVSQNKLVSLKVISQLSKEWHQLYFIDLSYNQINLENKLCNWGSNITRLILHHNTITSKSFECLPTTLHYLDLSYTQLERLDTDYFLHAIHLKELFLSGNKIKFIPSDWTSPSLRSLAVDGNSFGVLSKGSFQNMPQLISLKAGNNPYHCTCDLYMFVENTVQTKKLQLVNWPKDYICYHPESLLDTDIAAFSPARVQCDIGLVVAISASVTAAVVIVCMVLCWRFDVPWYLKATCQVIQSKYRSRKMDSSRSYTYHAFISYSHSDAEWVREELVPRLESCNPPYKICIHERDFMPGRWIIDNIIENIENSHKVIFVLSHNFVNSEWCNYELYFAHQRAIGQGFEDVILVVKETINPNSLPNKFCKLRKMLSTKTYLEWPAEPNRQPFFWMQLKNVLGK